MADKRKLDEVFVGCKTLIARVISRMVPPHEIEDIVQETYVRVCRFQSSNEVSNHRALMFQTAKNIAIDHLRRAENRLNIELDETSVEQMTSLLTEPGGLFDQVAADEEFAKFCQVVRELPKQCRRVFVLKKVYGHSQREIAQKLGLSESTVEKHVAKGMAYCAQRILSARETDGESARPSLKAITGGRSV